jgi:hypothetical protein
MQSTAHFSLSLHVGVLVLFSMILLGLVRLMFIPDSTGMYDLRSKISVFLAVLLR